MTVNNLYFLRVSVFLVNPNRKIKAKQNVTLEETNSGKNFFLVFPSWEDLTVYH